MKLFNNVLDRLIAAEKQIGIISKERDDFRSALAKAVLHRDEISAKLDRADTALTRSRNLDSAANALFDAADKFMRGPSNGSAKKELSDAMKVIEPLLDRIPF